MWFKPKAKSTVVLFLLLGLIDDNPFSIEQICTLHGQQQQRVGAAHANEGVVVNFIFMRQAAGLGYEYNPLIVKMFCNLNIFNPTFWLLYNAYV